MSQPITTRKATNADLPRLIAVFQHPDLKTSREEAEWFVRSYLDYHQIIVAEVGGEIQGACFWRIEGERYSGLGWIENLWVEEKFRNFGVGELLLRNAVDDIQTYFKKHGVKPRKIVLTTQEERSAARQLYEKVGFHHVASIEGMYDPGGHDMVYLMDL